MTAVLSFDQQKNDQGEDVAPNELTVPVHAPSHVMEGMAAGTDGNEETGNVWPALRHFFFQRKGNKRPLKLTPHFHSRSPNPILRPLSLIPVLNLDPLFPDSAFHLIPCQHPLFTRRPVLPDLRQLTAVPWMQHRHSVAKDSCFLLAVGGRGASYRS